MKTQLTKEQSKHLIELGVPANKAYTWYLGNNPAIRNDHIFNLTDLLKILPKDIIVKNNNYKAYLEICALGEVYTAGYMRYEFDSYLNWLEDKELIDVLYKLIIDLIDKEYLNF